MENVVTLYNGVYLYNRYNILEHDGSRRNVLRYDEPSVFHYAGAGDPFYVKHSVTRLEYHALRNAILASRITSPQFEYSDYLTSELKIISFPSKVVCDGLVPKTVALKWYQDGVLMAEATDSLGNGELRQILPAVGNKAVGKVLYGEGIILLFDSDDLGGDDEKFNSDVWRDSFLFPGAKFYDNVPTDPAWVRFFCPCLGGAYGCYRSVFEIHFETENKIFEKVFYIDLDGLNCSTNPTYFPEGGGVQNTQNEVFEVFDNTGVGPFVAVRKVGVYNSDRKLIGFVELAQPLIFSKENNYSIKVKIDF